jgi:hypothetical protein
VVAERLDEDPGEGPGFTLWGDRWLAGSAMPTLDRALSAINTAVVAEVRMCFRMSDMAPRVALGWQSGWARGSLDKTPEWSVTLRQVGPIPVTGTIAQGPRQVIDLCQWNTRTSASPPAAVSWAVASRSRATVVFMGSPPG